MSEAGEPEVRSGEAQLTMLVAALSALPLAEFLDVMRQVLPVQAANNARACLP